MAMKAASSDHSTHEGAYGGAFNGSRGRERLGTTIKKRSSHIPISTEIDAATVPQIVRRVRLFASRRKGTTKQLAAIVQKRGENLPSVFDRKMVMWAGSDP